MRTRVIQGRGSWKGRLKERRLEGFMEDRGQGRGQGSKGKGREGRTWGKAGVERQRDKARVKGRGQGGAREVRGRLEMLGLG